MLLDQQLDNPVLREFLDRHFVVIRDVRGFDDQSPARKFKIPYIPTVLVIDQNEKIIDRFHRHMDHAIDLQTKLQGVKDGKGTLLGLQNDLIGNPDNLTSLFNLALKLSDIDYSRVDKTLQLLGKILEREGEAKAFTVSKPETGEPVNLYEYTRYLHAKAMIYRDNNAEKLMQFVEEFPDSEFGEPAYNRMLSLLNIRTDTDQQQLYGLFNTALMRYGDSPYIVNLFMGFCLKNLEYLDAGIQAAQKLINAQVDLDKYFMQKYHNMKRRSKEN